MRLTINPEPELYAAAKSLARDMDCSISKAENRLLRRSLEPRPPSAGERRGGPASTGKAGLLSVGCDRVFTSEDVYQHDQKTS